jgi:hypothetical protein
LRTSKSYSASSSGVWLPSNLAGINAVRDEENDIEFIPVDISDIDPNDRTYRYTRKRGSDTPLFSGVECCSMTKGGHSITCSELKSKIDGGDITTVVGEFASVGEEPGTFEITEERGNEFIISGTYNGENIENEDLVIRPETTEKLFVYDSDYNIIDDCDFTVYYWKYPQALRRYSDIIYLPSAELLELSAIIKMPEAKRNRPVNVNQIEESLREALRINPEFRQGNSPRDSKGNMFRMNKSSIW